MVVGEHHRLGLVGELARGMVPFAATFAATRLLTRSWVVHEDALASVRAGFSRAELEDIAREAGLPNWSVRGRFPFRWLLTWQREGAS